MTSMEFFLNRLKQNTSKQFVVIGLSVLFLLTGCGNRQESKTKQSSLTTAQGGKYYGGVLKLNESEYIKNLFPHSIIDVYSYRVATQIYEGLFKFDQKNLDVIKCLAEDYSIDETSTIYTIKLKQGVYFHDDPCFADGKGRELTAKDIAYCFKLLCTQTRNNKNFHLFEGILKGADEYYKQSATGKVDGDIEGIKVLDKYTIQLTLNDPSSIFLYNLARPGTFVFPREAYEKYGIEMRIKSVGTGAFRLTAVDDDISIILKKNPNYHGKDENGNQLPFLDAVSIQFLKDKKLELLEFRKGNLDMMYRLPTDYIIEILQDNERGITKYELQRTPEMQTQFLCLYNQGGVFSDINVRKAFSFAVDREKILNHVLNGEGEEIGMYGFTPPTFKKYDVTKIKGYNFNRDSARFYLNKAGFSRSKPFPKVTLDLNAEGERFSNVAVEVQKQLNDNLGIDVGLNIIPHSQITEKSTSGDFDMIRMSWVADYPSPENYLWAFYGKTVPDDPQSQSYPNIARYKNEAFDAYYEKALASTSETAALDNFMKAEQIMMDDAAVLVLWYDEGYRLLRPDIKDFPNNAMQYRDLSVVYKKPERK